MENMSFFNVNAFIGRGAYGVPEYPTAASLIEHMNYMGVDRSLVWHVQARDINPSYGNGKLLSEVEKSGFNERIYPGFIVTPTCFFECGTMDFLGKHLSEGRIKALRITPDISRFQIREIERVLGELARFKPAVFWDSAHNEEDISNRDFEYIAGKFQEISFVITQKMWGGLSGIMDLMWRRDNIFVDTSWLHVRQIIELLVGNFGAERVLFGLGYRSHYGAPVAALAHAEISDSDRSLIAHGNAERILKLEPARKRLYYPPQLLERKPLWKTLRSGRPLKDVGVIDAHGHTPPHTRGWVLKQADMEKGMCELISQMDKLGIKKLILSVETALFGDNAAGNLEGERIFSKHPERFSGYLVFNPLYADEMASMLDEFFERGFFVGFKLLAAYWKKPITDEGYRPVWEYADRRRLPVLLHTWDDRYNSPVMLEDIAREHPSAKFILGHSGGGTTGRLEAEALAGACPNVYLEFCGSFTTPRPFEESLKLVGGDRVIFGSDTHCHDQAWELGRYLSMPLPDEELLPGLGANIIRILAESDLKNFSL